MESSLRRRLTEDRAQGMWRDLEPHALRDAVLLVDESLEIVDVGMALAANDTDRAQAWITAGKLRRPAREELDAWHEDPGHIFTILIVQPFVLAQETRLPSLPVEDPEGGATLEEIARFAAQRAEDKPDSTD